MKQKPEANGYIILNNSINNLKITTMVPKIGTKFKWLNKTFEVCKDENRTCKGCYFLREKENICTAGNYYTIPKCSYKIIFKLIEDGETEI